MPSHFLQRTCAAAGSRDASGRTGLKDRPNRSPAEGCDPGGSQQERGPAEMDAARMPQRMTQFLDRWYGHAPYCHLEECQRQWLGERVRLSAHAAGSFPVVPNGAFAGIELIASGNAELISRDMHGKEIGFRRLGPGDIYGFTALFCGGKGIYGVRAINGLTIFMLAQEDFTDLTDSNPKFKEFFYREAMDRIRQAYLSVNALVSAIDRLPSDNDFGSVKLNKSIALIKARYAEPLTLEDAASACGMSKFYYSRLFKSFIGCSFKEYLNRVRIEAAKEMLQQDRFNISEACYAVGYNDLSYFSRVFKRLERQSPSDYRRALKCRR